MAMRQSVCSIENFPNVQLHETTRCITFLLFFLQMFPLFIDGMAMAKKGRGKERFR